MRQRWRFGADPPCDRNARPAYAGAGRLRSGRGDPREEAAHGLPRSGLIAVTADALQGEDARCFAAGMDGFLPKPVSLDALARTLGRWIPDLATTAARRRGVPAPCSIRKRCVACSATSGRVSPAGAELRR